MSSDEPLFQWRRLREDEKLLGPLEVSSIPMPVDTGFGPVRYALGRNGEARLLVPCGSASRPITAKPSDRLFVSQTSLRLDGKRVNFVDVVCVAQELDPVFADLTQEIVRRINAGHPPIEAVDSSIADFRALLDASLPRGVDSSALIGLLGELLVLRELAAVQPMAVSAWQGPSGQRHDFRSATRAIEVKTSARSDAQRVTVHGIDQLEQPDGGELVLVHVKLERAASGEIFVKALVDELLHLQVDASALRAVLAEFGCADPDASEWNVRKFCREGTDWYQIAPGFPRIVGESFSGGGLPASISGLTYSVDLAAASKWRMASAEVTHFIQRFMP